MLERGWQLGKEALAVPLRLRRHLGFAMNALMVGLDQKLVKAVGQLTQRQVWCLGGRPRWAPLRPGGTVLWPSSFLPHATTVPSLLTATVCDRPAATWVTPLRPGGTQGVFFLGTLWVTTPPKMEFVE